MIEILLVRLNKLHSTRVGVGIITEHLWNKFQMGVNCDTFLAGARMRVIPDISRVEARMGVTTDTSQVGASLFSTDNGVNNIFLDHPHNCGVF